MANPIQIFDEDGQNSLKVNPDGSINVTANISITESDIQIGAVEIKDATTQARASVDQTYGLKVDVSRVQGGTITVQDGGGSITVDGTVNIGNTVTIAEPVTVDGTVIIQDGGSSITVDGSVSLSSPVAISGVVPVSDNGGSLTVDGTVNIGNSVAISGPVSISGSVPVTDGGGSLTVDGAVSVSNTVTVADGGGSLTVDGTVTVQDGGASITVDDGGSSLTVDGTVGITGSVTVVDGGGSLTVDGTVNVGNVVPISDNNGSITVDGSVAITNSSIAVTDNGGSLTVDGSVSIVGTPTRTQTFTLQNAASALGNGTQADVTGYATGTFAISISGTATVTVERSQDGSTWFPLNTFYSTTSGYPVNIVSNSRTTTADLSGCVYVRAQISAYTSGTVTVSLHATLSEGKPTGGVNLQPSVDGRTGDITTQAVTSFGLAFNGTTWDRLRSVNTGQLKTSLYGTTGNALAINADGSLNVNTNADIQIGAVEIKDATTDTRVTVDATYGMGVDVKRIASPVAVTDNGSSLTVDDGNGSLTVDGSVSIIGTVPVSDGGSSISIDDNGGSITVDGTVAISNTSFPVTDNGGSLTVDTTQLPATLTASGNLKVAISEGGISGTVTVQDGGGSLTVDDGGGSLTVDTPQLPTALTVGGNLKVSLSESNATVTVQDGGGSITVDGSVNITNTTIAVTDNGGSLTVDGTVTIQDGGNSITTDTGQLPAALTAGGYLKVSVQENTTSQTVTIQDGGNVISVDDAGGSLTIDSPQLPSTLTGSGNLKVSISESTTGVTVTDGGGSLTVDGTVGVSGTVTTTESAAVLTTYNLQTAAAAIGNGTVATISGNNELALNILITGTATVVVEYSLDNTNWYALQGTTSQNVGQISSTYSVSALARFNVSAARYVRARISAWTSGTVNVVGYASVANYSYQPNIVQPNADTLSASTYTQVVTSAGHIFNGSNWVRQRTADSIFDGNAGGLIPATTLYGFNGTTFDRIKTVNTGQVRTSLYGTTGNALAVNADGSLNVNTNADIQIGAVEIKDGTTDTRAVVDSTYGLKVDVSRVGGTVTIQDGGNSITVDGSVTVSDGAGSLTVDSTQLPTALTASGNLKVALVEDTTVISVDDAGGSLTVDSTQLPSSLSGSGNLKVALSESSASVTVADGGGSITTDTTQLPSALTASGNLKVALSESGATVNVADNGGSLTVDSTQLPTALTAGGNLKVAIQEGGLTGSVSNAADAVATSTTNLGTVGYGFGFNGTTWDRVRTVSGLADAVTTGLSAGGRYVFNGTNWDRQRTASSDAMAATGMQAAGLMGYNGTTWDRLRVDANKNLNVNINASGATVNVADGGGSLTVDGTVAISNASIPVTDNGSSLTIDSTQLPTALTVGGNLKVSLNESSATVNVADGGGSLTVDGTVAISNSSIAVTDNGGSLTVDGTVAISNTSIAVTDNGGSLTVDSAQLPTALSAGGNLKVSIQEGGFSGSVSNASDSVATSSTNIGAVSYLYGFDGTTWDRLKVDANGSLQVTTDRTSMSASFTFQNAAGAVGNGSVADVTGYSVATVRVVLTGTATVAFEASNDNTNFDPIAGITPFTSTYGNSTTVSNTFQFNISGFKYLRMRVSTWTSGTVTATGFFGQGTLRTPHGSVLASVADGLSTSNTVQLVQSANAVYNGTTWDRVRSAASDALAATGLLGAGNMFYNGSTWDRGRTATADALAVTGIQAKGTMLYNGTNWDRARTASGDGLAATGLQASGLMGYNGATWDRLRVDGSDNLNVNIAKATSGSTTLFNAVTTTGTSTAVSVDGYASAFVSVETGPNFNTIFKLQGTVDGTKWWTLRGLDYESGTIDGQFQGDRSIHYNISGLLQVRGNITAIVGTTTVKLRYQTTEVSIGAPQVAINNTVDVSGEVGVFGDVFAGGYRLNPNSDGSIAIGDGTDALAINSDGSLNITDNGGSLTVDGTVAISNSSIAVTDNGSSLTVDSAQLPSTLSSNNLRVSLGEVQKSTTTPLQSNATAVGNGIPITCAGYASALLVVNIVASATVVFEGTIDGSTFFSISGMNVTTRSFHTSVTNDDAVLYSNATYAFNVAGLSSMRARISVYNAGTSINVTGITSTVPYDMTGGVDGSYRNKIPYAQYNTLSAVTTVTNGTAINTTGYNFVSFKCVSTGIMTVAFEYSNTGASGWNTLNLFVFDNNGIVSTLNVSGTKIAYAQLPPNVFVRANVTTVTSAGSTTVEVNLSNQAPPLPAMFSQMPMTQLSMMSSGTLYTAAITSPSDGSGAFTSLYTSNQNLIYNGSTWDRIRGAAAINDTTSATQAGLPVVASVNYNGSQYERTRISKVYKWNEYLGLTTTAGSNTNFFTVWSAASKRIRLMGISVSVSGSCALNVRYGTASTGTTIVSTRLMTLRFSGAGNYTVNFGNGFLMTNTTDVIEIHNPTTNPTSATVDVHVTAWGTEE